MEVFLGFKVEDPFFGRMTDIRDVLGGIALNVNLFLSAADIENVGLCNLTFLAVKMAVFIEK